MSGKRQESEKQGIMLVRMPTAETEFSTLPGAYALLIRLQRPLCTDIGALGPVMLSPGSYLYLGSANGPGGLRARLRRHLRAEKKPHWHVDRLTEAGDVIEVLAVPGGSECNLVACALNLVDVTVPHPGFGSSDCRRCAAHLLAVPKADETVLDELRHVVAKNTGKKKPNV